jgi:lycopene cyclase domain-containing protein
LIPLIFFLIWDLAGIAAGIFFRGTTQHLTGILISEELPLEEIFFLILLSYSALLLLKAFNRLGTKK